MTIPNTLIPTVFHATLDHVIFIRNHIAFLGYIEGWEQPWNREDKQKMNPCYGLWCEQAPAEILAIAAKCIKNKVDPVILYLGLDIFSLVFAAIPEIPLIPSIFCATNFSCDRCEFGRYAANVKRYWIDYIFL